MVVLNKTGKNPRPFLKVGSENKANTLEYRSKTYIKVDLYTWLKALTAASMHKTVLGVFNILIDGVRLHCSSAEIESFYTGPREEPTRWNCKAVRFTERNYLFLRSRFSYGKASVVHAILNYLRMKVLTPDALRKRETPKDRLATYYMQELFGVAPLSGEGPVL